MYGKNPGTVSLNPSRTFSPFWNEESKPTYLNASGTQYSRAPYNAVLTDRNITNRLLDSLYFALGPGVIIAGGFMTSVLGENRDANDIDLFFTSEEALRRTVQLLVDPTNSKDFDDKEHWAVVGYTPDEFSTKAIDSKSSLADVRYLKFVHPKRPPIQLIKLYWYQDAEQVIDSFDLTLAQVALDCGSGELVYNPLAVFDILRKRIVLHRMQFPASTLRRVIKYGNKGYYACPGSLIRIAQECATAAVDPANDIVYVD